MTVQTHNGTNRHGIGFRVLCYDGSQPNHVGLIARNPNAPNTTATLRNHLQWRRLPTPYYSVFWSIKAALRKAEGYRNNTGAQRVAILLLDLELLGVAIDAYAFASREQLGNLQVYWSEHVYHNFIPRQAVLAELPIGAPPILKHVSTGHILAPGNLWEEAKDTYDRRLSMEGGWRYVEALREWFYDQLWAKDLSPDRVILDRMVESMFVSIWD